MSEMGIVRCLGVVIAPVLVGIGVAMVQTAGLGMVPNGLLQFVIGLLLGGVFGIGTVISALLTGPSIQWASP